ncbi:MAG: HD-GYP domain-containing protein [Thermomicrobiales bacterium]
MAGFASYPRGLKWYLAAVACGGPALAIAAFLAGGATGDGRSLVVAFLLIGAGVLAERTALPLTHHTHISVATALYIAMLWLLPVSWAGVVALLAVATAEALRVVVGRSSGWVEFLFNSGQSALSVVLGAAVFSALNLIFPAAERQLFGLADLLLAGLAMHAGNSALVATAGALQTGISPLRAWRLGLLLDLGPHAALILLGATAAIATSAEPIVIPALLLPFLLMQQSVRQGIQLRADTRHALAQLVDVVELRDPYTAGHSRRVAETARALAREFGLTEEEADLIERAGRVHDLGKVAVDPSVLFNTGKLNEAEWAQMRLHPVFGTDVVKEFGAYQEGMRLVRHHHEHWDGGGYPDGIAGEAIRLGARMLAIADTFDALTSDRPYRAGMSVDRARSILREGAGTQWDADVVAALLKILDERPGQIPLHRLREPEPDPVVLVA